MPDRLSCWLIDRYAQVYVCFNPVTPVDTGRITDHIYAVKTGQVNFFLYRKNGQFICVDTGFGKAVIRRELRSLKIEPGRISHIFLTHSDFDHAGGVSLFPGARVYLSRDEEQMVNGGRARMFGLVYNKLPRDGYTLLSDGETLMAGESKVTAIATPGHTPGSMSYLVDGQYLFTGDAFRIIDGVAQPNRAFLTMDPSDGAESLRKLARVPDVRMVLTAHRGWAENYAEVMAPYMD